MKIMSGIIGKRKLSVLLLASLMSTSLAFADAYKNNVVDVKVNKESNNAVKVTIYTDKPYTEPVVVNKKANNKYVILMPETKSNLKSTPTMTNVTGSVSNVTVNTQEVSGGKGYTKIIITSDKAINIVPRTQQLATSKQQPTTKTSATTQKPTVTSNTPVKTASATTTKKQVSADKKQQKTETKKTTTANNTSKPTIKQQVKNSNSTSKPVTKPVQSQPVRKITETKPVKQPIEVLEQEIKTNKTAPVMADNKNDTILNNEIKENKIKSEKENSELTTVQENKNNQFFDGLKGIEFWKLLLLAGAVTFPIIVIMVILGMDKKINKNIEKTFKREDDYRATYIPEETPQNTEYTEVDEPAPNYPDTTQTPVYNSFDDMLNQVEEPEMSYHEEQLITDNEPELTEDSDTDFENDFEDEDFEHDFSEDVMVANNEVAQTIEEISQKEITEESYEPQVSEPEQEFIVEPEQEEQTIQMQNMLSVPEENIPSEMEEESYNPDGYLSEFSGIDDKDFFDELTLQSMAQNNADGLPEQLPADEIFDFMLEDIEDDFPENTNYTDSVSEENNETVQSIVNEAPAQESTSYDDDLTMLTEVKLNDNTGLYLVNYENFSSLVGHIDDDYFVIKKFDDIVNDKIFLKETEKLNDATRYLVRIGKNKMVVEVSDTSMSRLLDL